ncbi:uncharacterized protein ARMOST_18635 [Armillaria ostoyae]|uniref:F-box domain-containing protein n=1 Tax=Armillaria ostoyae TaxID=47428 RepID=A0A284S2A4_ARMOS|nr:uncharacterized protein ARMOST_18635 [Armillaria ostoyae]
MDGATSISFIPISKSQKTTKLSNWIPCTECACPNHRLPSYPFNLPTKLSDNPDWARLSHSNDAPSPGEEGALLAMISSYNSQLQSLELEESVLQTLFHELKAQMKSLPHKTGTLHQQHARISEAIRERRRILSPVRRLPSEILHRFNNIHWNFHPTESALWSITGVSKRWRDVALTSPKLWSFVNISITDEAFDDLAYIRQLGLQLHRAIKYPLSVSICDIDAESSYEEIPQQLIAILFSFSSSIRELHLYLPSVLLSDLARLQLSLPLLESLVIICTDGIELPNYGQLRLFSFIPQLRSFQVIDVTNVQESFELPWHLVKEYRSDHVFHFEYPTRQIGPRAHEHLAILRNLVQVENCVLRLGDNSEDEFEDSVFPLVCPQLRSLELSSWSIADHYTHHSALQQVSDRLTLPALSVLKVSCAENDDEETEEVFTSICRLLLRSHSPITVFHLKHCRASPEDLLQLLRSAHTLEDVRLIDIRSRFVTTEVIEELTLDHSSSKDLMLPRLRTLYISGTKFSSQCLIRMVKSRWGSGEQMHGVERLLTVKMCGRYSRVDSFRETVLAQLKGCIEGGFSFEIGPCVSG